MPTYEYRCHACGHKFEKFQQITAAAIRKCPRCGKRKVQRLIGAGAGIIFKGNGFYQTDYRSDSYRKAAEKEKTSTASKDDSPKTGGKTDTPASGPDKAGSSDKAGGKTKSSD